MMQKMIQLKKLVLNVLFLSTVFCTSQIHNTVNRFGLRGSYKETEGFKNCLVAMKNTFNLDIDAPRKQFVKVAIQNFHSSQLNSMHQDVKEFYELMINKLNPARIQWPIQFCYNFIKEEKKLNQLLSNIRFKVHTSEDFKNTRSLERLAPNQLKENITCNAELEGYTQDSTTESHILKKALYNYMQCNNNDQEPIYKHNPYSYGYFYLEDIANRVLMSKRMFGPRKFCINKHVRLIDDKDASSEEEEASSSNLDV